MRCFFSVFFLTSLLYILDRLIQGYVGTSLGEGEGVFTKRKPLLLS